MPATKERTKKADALEQALTEAESEFAAATAEHAAAKQVYADARAAKDVEAMAPALARAEAAADLKQDAEGKVAAAQEAIRVRRAAAEQKSYLDQAETLGLALAAECASVETLRGELAEAISSLPGRIRAHRQKREAIRQELARMDSTYNGGDLASDVEDRGRVKLGGVLRSPQFAADWGEQRFGEMENGISLNALMNVLSEAQHERGARIGGQRGLVI